MGIFIITRPLSDDKIRLITINRSACYSALQLIILLSQFDKSWLVAKGGDDFMNQIFRSQPEAGGIDAGVHTHKFADQYIFIDEQLDLVFFIVHQSQKTQ